MEDRVRIDLCNRNTGKVLEWIEATPEHCAKAGRFLADEWYANHPYQGVRQNLELRFFVDDKLAFQVTGLDTFKLY